MKMNTWDINHIEKSKKRNLESLEGCLLQQESLKSWNKSALIGQNDLCGIQKQKQKLNSDFGRKDYNETK